MIDGIVSLPLLLAQTEESGNILTYFGDSNFAGKIIIGVLIVASVLAWSVMLGKYLDLKRFDFLNRSFDSKLNKLEYLDDLNRDSKMSSPYAKLVKEALEADAKFAGKAADIKTRMGHVENAIQRSVSSACNRYEDKMVYLGSIVTAAPFLGLLGTAWGVMDAFGSMGSQNAATIQALAPGVSGALLTTVFGLVVAIPSVLGYNYLLMRTKLLITDLENFASRIADRIELEME